VKRNALLALEAFGLPTVVFAIALALAPGHAGVIAHSYVVFVVAGVLCMLVVRLARDLRSTEPSTFERGLVRVREPSQRIQQLEQLEREVTMGRQNAWDLHTRLAPTLRDTAAALLVSRRGIDLEREPARAETVLGAEAWDLVRAGRAAPEDRHEPGVSLPQLENAVSALERL